MNIKIHKLKFKLKQLVTVIPQTQFPSIKTSLSIISIIVIKHQK